MYTYNIKMILHDITGLPVGQFQCWQHFFKAEISVSYLTKPTDIPLLMSDKQK